VTDAKTRDSGNTILHKTFPGGHITAAGANSPASLASRPVRIVLFDEVDRFPPSAGTEGDPVKLATKRTQAVWNRKIIHTSTPTVKGVSRIEALWMESNRQKYFVPCPHCGVYQILLWAGVKWDKTNGKDDLNTVHYECSSCKQKIFESDKYGMIQKGGWRSENPEVKRHAGFFINELYSPWSTWRTVVENFLEAKKRPETLRVWINTTLGETWEDEGSYSISDERIAARVEDYEDVPSDCVLLTAGIDVHDDRIEIVVKGWGVKDESWLIDRRVFYGSPARSQTWQLLDDYLLTNFKHESGLNMRIVTACVDSQGHFTENVYAYVKPRQIRRIYAIKGMSGVGRPLIGKPSKHNRQRVSLFPLGVDTAKELIFARLNQDEIGPGYMHFNRRCDDDYFKQLTAEKQVTKFSKGFPTKVWVKVRPRNEALDCEVYALCAYTLLNPNMEKIANDFKVQSEKIKGNDDAPIEKVNPDTPKPIKKVRNPFKKNFATNW